VTEAAPLDDAAFAASMAQLGPFEPAPRLAVAVSGGADSLALAVLAGRWAAARGGSVLALTVDHGLRPGSAGEAAATLERLRGLGLAAELLRWEGEKPSTGLQDAARHARYALFAAACRRHGLLHLLLAHHADDQAETVLLRHAAGSGAGGLAAMPAVREMAGLRLLRPLLGVAKARLAATCRAAGLDWVEDPSNRNPAFARARLRAGLGNGDGAALAAAARRAGAARAEAEWALATLAAAALTVHPEGWGEVALPAWRALPESARRQWLGGLVAGFGGAAYPPRGEGLARLSARLAAAERGRATLGGCVLGWAAGRLRLHREARHLPAPCRIEPGAALHWDGRFRLRLRADSPPMIVEPYRGGAAAGGAPLPAAVRAALPAVRPEGGGAAALPDFLGGGGACTALFAPRHPVAPGPFGIV